jgi:oligopeptide transport system ATP-binding protein
MTTTGATGPIATGAPNAAVDGPLLAVEDLRVWFPISDGIVFQRHIGDVRAVDGVTFSMQKGETLGLVGESGCGKSTTGRAIIRLHRPTTGTIKFLGTDISGLEGAELRQMRRRMQMIFQDPYASLNPRMNVDGIIGEPMEIHGVGSKAERHERVRDLLATVGLNPDFGSRYPHEFSGGQRQRIGVARALALNPDLIVADEPVSALDVSIRAQIINLLQQLQQELGLSYLFIAHDLAVVRHLSDRVAVMYLGQIVEQGAAADLYTDPRHPYTVSLLSAVPVPDPAIKRTKLVVQGDVPSPLNPPPGCRFHTRCPYAEARCKVDVPLLREVEPGHHVACHLR